MSQDICELRTFLPTLSTRGFWSFQTSQRISGIRILNKIPPVRMETSGERAVSKAKFAVLAELPVPDEGGCCSVLGVFS